MSDREDTGSFVVAKEDAQRDVSLAVLDERLRAIDRNLSAFRKETRDSMQPLAAEVKSHGDTISSWRGALRLAAFVVGLLAAGGISWAAYLTVTTVRTEQAVSNLHEAVEATKAHRAPRYEPREDPNP